MNTYNSEINAILKSVSEKKKIQSILLSMNARTKLWVLVFLGFWINDMFKSNVNIVFMCMVKDHNRNQNITNNIEPSDKTIGYCEKSTIKQITFNWDESQQESILNSFFWMHWVTQLPGGILTHYYGTKMVFGMAILLGAVSNLLIPLAAKMDVNVLLAVRLFQGFVGGVTWPSIPSLTAKWIPPRERAIFLSSYLGGSAGWGVTYVLSNFITEKFGWQYVFYIQSIFGVIWCVTWNQLIYDNPAQHPRISSKEKAHILDSTRKAGLFESQSTLPIPWKAILTSRAVWANLIACMATLWGLFTLVTLSIFYLRSFQGLDLKSIGIFFSIAHIARWLLASIIGITGKYQKCIAVGKVRKIITSVCTICAGSMILTVGLFSSNFILSMVALFLAIMSLGVQGAGPVAIFIDISPNFSEVLAGVSGSAGALSGLLSPILLAYMMRNDQTSLPWQKLFSITAFICFVGGIANLLFGTSKLQSWNEAKVEDSSEQKKLYTRTTLSFLKTKNPRMEMISM